MADKEAGKSSDDLDLDLDSPRKQGGCGWGTIIAVVLIVAAVGIIAFGWVRYSEKKQQEKEERQTMRQAQLSTLGTELMTEVARVQSGDINGGLTTLKKASSALAAMIADAQTAGDNEDAAILQQKKQAVDRAVTDVGKAQETLTKMLTDSLQESGSAMGGKAKPGAEGKPEGALTAPAAATPAASAAPAAPVAPAAPAVAPPAKPAPPPPPGAAPAPAPAAPAAPAPAGRR